MPTVTYKCGMSGREMTKTFPYNATGKAQADSFAKVTGGSLVNNPNYGMEGQSTTKKNKSY